MVVIRELFEVIGKSHVGFVFNKTLFDQVHDLTYYWDFATVIVPHKSPMSTFFLSHLATSLWPLQVFKNSLFAINLFNFIV
jgi:hypothetical protein